MKYDWAMEARDFAKINKLNTITNVTVLWDSVRRWTKNTHSDHALRRWEILAEARERELKNE